MSLRSQSLSYFPSLSTAMPNTIISHDNFCYKDPKRRTMFLYNYLIPILIIFNLSFLIQSTNGASSAYVEQYLTSPDICPPVASGVGKYFPLLKEQIRLANFPNNTVIVKLSRWQERNPVSAHLNFKCTFEVTAPKGWGVMMTIRRLYLRTYSAQPSCRDYLRFKPEGLPHSPYVCGQIDSSVSDQDKVPLGLVGPRHIHDSKAGLDVTISTDSDNHNELQDPLLVELVFTAYRQCSYEPTKGMFEHVCSGLTDRSCIPRNLVCDGIVNCAIGDEYGSDERGCKPKDEVSRAMSIFIFAMTALGTLVTAAICILLVCMCCRRCTQKGTSSNRRERTTRERQPATVTITNNPSDFIANIRRSSTPTAPELNLSEMPGYRPGSPPKAVIEDDDMPPSYKDLFPGSGTIPR